MKMSSGMKADIMEDAVDYLKDFQKKLRSNQQLLIERLKKK